MSVQKETGIMEEEPGKDAPETLPTLASFERFLAEKAPDYFAQFQSWQETTQGNSGPSPNVSSSEQSVLNTVKELEYKNRRLLDRIAQLQAVHDNLLKNVEKKVTESVQALLEQEAIDKKESIDEIVERYQKATEKKAVEHVKDLEHLQQVIASLNASKKAITEKWTCALQEYESVKERAASAETTVTDLQKQIQDLRSGILDKEEHLDKHYEMAQKEINAKNQNVTQREAEIAKQRALLKKRETAIDAKDDEIKVLKQKLEEQKRLVSATRRELKSTKDAAEAVKKTMDTDLLNAVSEAVEPHKVLQEKLQKNITKYKEILQNQASALQVLENRNKAMCKRLSSMEQGTQAANEAIASAAAKESGLQETQIKELTATVLPVLKTIVGSATREPKTFEDVKAAHSTLDRQTKYFAQMVSSISSSVSDIIKGISTLLNKEFSTNTLDLNQDAPVSVKLLQILASLKSVLSCMKKRKGQGQGQGQGQEQGQEQGQGQGQGQDKSLSGIHEQLKQLQKQVIEKTRQSEQIKAAYDEADALLQKIANYIVSDDPNISSTVKEAACLLQRSGYKMGSS